MFFSLKKNKAKAPTVAITAPTNPIAAGPLFSEDREVLANPSASVYNLSEESSDFLASSLGFEVSFTSLS